MKGQSWGGGPSPIQMEIAMSGLDRSTRYRARVCFFFLNALVSTYVMAQVAPPLGQAGSFAVLAGSTVTNVGPTSVLGDLGVSPGSAVVGFPPGSITAGTIHSNDAVAQGAQADATTAYNTLAGEASNASLTGQDLGGLTLVSGVYTFASSAQLTGTLTLDAQGDPGAVFVFQIATSLTTASGSRVVVINGGTDCNVFWQVGSSATLGTTTDFAGSILALSSITLNTGGRLSGRALALTGAVTLDTNDAAICGTCGALTIAPAALPPMTMGTPYSQQMTASGGTAPYSFTIIAGALPPGISLSTAGTLSGTPTASGTFSFMMRGTDSAGCTGDLIYTLIVNAAACATLTVAPTSIQAPVLGAPYMQMFSATGGVAPYTFVVGSGALPQGLSLGAAGALSGTPAALGNFTFTVVATDSEGCSGSQLFTVVIQPALCNAISLTPPTMNQMVVGVPFLQTMNAAGGVAPYTFVVVAGQVPAGLAMQSTGAASAAISGTPQSAANYSFTMLVTDGNGCSVRNIYGGTVTGLVAAVPAPSLSVWGELGLLAALFGAAAWSVKRKGRGA